MFGNKKALGKFNACPLRGEIKSTPEPLAYGPTSLDSFFGYFSASLDPNMKYPRTTEVQCPNGGGAVEVTGSENDGIEALRMQMAKQACKNCPSTDRARTQNTANPNKTTIITGEVIN